MENGGPRHANQDPLEGLPNRPVDHEPQHEGSTATGSKELGERPTLEELVNHKHKSLGEGVKRDQEARCLASRMADVSRTQLQRFYRESLTIRRRIEQDKTLDAAFIQSELVHLEAMAVSVIRRKYRDKSIDQILDTSLPLLFAKAVDGLSSAQDPMTYFEEFLLKFEAVMAYHLVYSKR